MTGKKSLSGSFFSVRCWFQLIFLGIVLAVGVQFTWFVFLLEKGIVPDFNRPPGVEAFLPISALVSLKHMAVTGTINDIHPSAGDFSDRLLHSLCGQKRVLQLGVPVRSAVRYPG